LESPLSLISTAQPDSYDKELGFSCWQWRLKLTVLTFVQMMCAALCNPCML